MPFTKTFGTTSGAYNTETLWLPINIRSSAFAWTASGSGTNEYYVRTAAGGDPGFVASPPTSNGVFINGSAATKGTLGSLAAGNWGYGDNDTLGYSTVYVRLSGGGDPDAQVDNHIYFKQMPQAGEHVRFASDSGSIDSATGLDQSAVAIGDFIVERGYAGSIGSATLGYLLIDPDRFEYEGTGEAWLNLTTANIPATIKGTAFASEGYRGLYLKGTALTVLNIMGGSVGLAVRPGEISTATTIRLLGESSSLWIGNGVSLTTLNQYGGDCIQRCGATTVLIYEGSHTSEENGAVTTVNLRGGSYVWKSSGTITNFNIYGGELDMQQSGAARTVTNLNKHRGNYRILRNKEAVTITTEAPQDSYIESVST